MERRTRLTYQLRLNETKEIQPKLNISLPTKSLTFIEEDSIMNSNTIQAPELDGADKTVQIVEVKGAAERRKVKSKTSIHITAHMLIPVLFETISNQMFA